MGMYGLRHERFNTAINPRGIDRERSRIMVDEGTHIAADASIFRAGQWLKKVGDTLTQCTAVTDRPLGVAAVDKFATGTSLRVDLPLTVGAVGETVSLTPHGPVVGLVVRTLPDMGGATVAAGATTYTVNTTTGLVTWGDESGGILAGDTVYATYAFEMTNSDFIFDGKDARMGTDSVTRAASRVAVIQGNGLLYTTEWLTSRVPYAVPEALFLSAGAQLSNNSAASAKFLGQVHQLPTATDPYLGAQLHGDPVV